MSWIESVPPWAAALPWLLAPAVIYWQWRHSRSLDDYAPASPGGPKVSIVVPARNEAHNIERCLGSILATAYDDIELVVVDDHSSDETGAVAARTVGSDPRARITVPPPLPADWFGKQWACAHGASMASGDVLLFTDADTWHAPDLVPRAVTALQQRQAALLSVSGRQEMGSFAERLVQPAMFVILFALFGGAETMSRSRNPRRKVANGQCFLVRRDVYDQMGGHAAVRAFSAEDAMLAQSWTRAGHAVHMVLGTAQLSTRMYRSWGELVQGWEKNYWTAGRHVLPDSAIVRAAARVTLPGGPLSFAAPFIALVAGLLGFASPWWTAFGAFGTAFDVAGMLVVYSAMGAPRAFAWLHPIGSLAVAYISARAAWRGDRTTWKGREYRAA